MPHVQQPAAKILVMKITANITNSSAIPSLQHKLKILEWRIITSMYLYSVILLYFINPYVIFLNSKKRLIGIIFGASGEMQSPVRSSKISMLVCLLI